MEELAVILVRGLGLGAVFALVAMSLNAVHRASGIFNFAQGAMMVLGGIIAARYMPNVPDPYRWLLFLPVATVALAAIMTIQGYITLLPLRSSVEQHSWLVSTLAVSVLIGAVILLIQGNARYSHEPVSEFPGLRHAHARAVHHGDHPRARLVRRAALVSQPHADRIVDQRRCAGSRRRACGRSARTTGCNCSPSASVD